MNEDNVFMNLYQNEVDGYNFELRKDSSHIPVNYAKLILAKYGVGDILFDGYCNGKMMYVADFCNCNDVYIEIIFDIKDIYMAEYETDDIEIISKGTIITETRGLNKSFLFDNPKKGIKGVAVDKWSKKYLVI